MPGRVHLLSRNLLLSILMLCWMMQAAPTLRHLLQMLPKLFSYDLQQTGPAGAVPEYMGWLHVYMKFGLECHTSLHDTWADSLHQVIIQVATSGLAGV